MADIQYLIDLKETIVKGYIGKVHECGNTSVYIEIHLEYRDFLIFWNTFLALYGIVCMHGVQDHVSFVSDNAPTYTWRACDFKRLCFR